MWMIFAFLSALFAALTTILAKIGIKHVDSTLATAIRTAVVLFMAWGMVFLTHGQKGIGEINPKSWLFLILSGLATGASWLCYYRAIQIGDVSKVVPIDNSQSRASQIKSRCSRLTRSISSWYISLMVDGRMPVLRARSACVQRNSPSFLDSKILIIVRAAPYSDNLPHFLTLRRILFYYHGIGSGNTE